jgi:hypothetical protein
MTTGQKILAGHFVLFVCAVFWWVEPHGLQPLFSQFPESWTYKLINVSDALLGNWGGVIILGLFYGIFRFFRPKEQKDLEGAAKLYEQASRDEVRGHTYEALAGYDQITRRFPDTEVANDAKISAENLRKRNE